MATRRPSPLLKSLEELDAAALGEVIERASQLREEKISEARAALKAETEAKARALGLAVEDLFDGGALRAKRGRGPARQSARAKARPVMFQSPQGETWSGRGRPPRWIVALEAKGHKRDKYRV